MFQADANNYLYWLDQLSLLKTLSDLKGGTQKISKKRLRKMFGWNFNDSLSEALTLMDPYTFARAVEITPRKPRKR